MIYIELCYNNIGDIVEVFLSKLMEKENKYADLAYIAKIGEKPIMLTAVHTMMQIKDDSSIKYSEPFTKAIALYVAEAVNCSYLIKNKDTGVDPNASWDDSFKNMLLENIKDNNIKLVIDLHGAKKEREFDVELGNLNNLSTDYATINELIDAFNEQGIFKIEVNSPFKGGAITQKVYAETNCEAIQIEINAAYRNINEPTKIKAICDALIAFINQFNDIIER